MAKQSQPLRIEDTSVASFCTSRCINSAMWFINNKALEGRVLGYLAKYQQHYGVKIYGATIMANHAHIIAAFPNANRSAFMRDLNARTAEGVRYHVSEFDGGPVFEKRYSCQAVVESEDIEDRVLYTALQPVNHGLCPRISQYPGYNSFYDAISGHVKEYPVVDWAGYNKRRRYKKEVDIEEYTTYYSLVFSRIPEYDNIEQEEYKKLMLAKLEARRTEIINKKLEQGFIYPTDLSFLTNTIPGTKPRKTKKSGRYSKLPRIFCKNLGKFIVKSMEYEHLYYLYKGASRAYLGGNEYVQFPTCTYKPPRFLVCGSPPIN
ncbi:MAG: transposase [Deltaproteobacteria bacterium]|nr:transposase [Deltaproteobacteria bacterium]